MNKDCSLCDELKRLSHETWERIGFVRTRSGFKIFETTITQNILFSLKKFTENCSQHQLQMFEAIDEKTNGNDIEIFLQVGDKYISLPTQAKILYSSSKYTAMDHGNQINDLLSYSKRVGGFPLYLLYNYISDQSFKDYGCSFIDAEHLFYNYAFKSKTRSGKIKWIIPTFSDLHPGYALPWYELFCISLNDLEDLSVHFGDAFTLQLMRNKNLKYYTIEELTSNPNWKAFSLDFVEKENKDESSQEGFRPKFRLIISNEKIKDGTKKL